MLACIDVGIHIGAIYIYIYIYIYMLPPPLMYPRFVLESCAISETGPNYRVFKRIQGVFN